MSESKKTEPTNVHPLNRSWTLWYDSPTTYNADNWALSLCSIITVRTVENFLLMLKYMKPLHALRTSAQYHLFQEGVKPMWEDEANKEGGKLTLNVDQQSILNVDSLTWGLSEDTSTSASNVDGNVGSERGKNDLDSVWRNVLMAVVGETLENPNDPNPQIVGVVMSKKKSYNRLALWLKDANNVDAINWIRKRLIEEAPFKESVCLEFNSHKDATVRKK